MSCICAIEKFTISWFSFLYCQTNTPAAEVLYSAVGEWAQLDQDSTVLDVCCGTGTIGISLAKVWLLLLRILWVNRKLFSEQQLAKKKVCVVINRGWRRWLALNCARRQWKMLRLMLKLTVSQSVIIFFCCFSLSISHDLLKLQMYIFRLDQCWIPLWKGWRRVPHCS